MSGTPIAKMVREMIAKGVDPDVIELAVATAETVAAPMLSGGSPVDTTADKRRAYDRDRKAREREIHRTSGGNPRTSENASLSKESKKEEKEEREEPKRNVRGHRLPDDWAPEEADWQAAKAAVGSERAFAELAKFRDHWKQQPGSKGVKLDWNAAWRNWIRRAAEYSGGRPTGPPGRPQQKSFADIARDLQQQINGHDHSSHEPSFDLGEGPVIDADAYHRS